MPLPSIQILMEFYSESCNYFIVKGFGFGFGFGFSETFGFWFRFRRNRKRGFVGSLINSIQFQFGNVIKCDFWTDFEPL